MINRLRVLWETTDKSATVISREFGCSKNAVIGAANRNGFKPRGSNNLKSQTAVMVARRLREADETRYGPQPGKCLNVEERITYGVFRYCSNVRAEGSSWCHHHHDLFHFKIGRDKKPWNYATNNELKKAGSADNRE